MKLDRWQGKGHKEDYWDIEFVGEELLLSHSSSLYYKYSIDEVLEKNNYSIHSAIGTTILTLLRKEILTFSQRKNFLKERFL